MPLIYFHLEFHLDLGLMTLHDHRDDQQGLPIAVTNGRASFGELGDGAGGTGRCQERSPPLDGVHPGVPREADHHAMFTGTPPLLTVPPPFLSSRECVCVCVCVCVCARVKVRESTSLQIQGCTLIK